MRKYVLIFIAMAAVACQPSSRESFTLTGKVTGASDGLVLMQDRIDGLMVTVDSVEMTNGQFVFTGKLKHPEVYYFTIEGVASRLAVFLENSKMTMEVDASAPSQFAVKGSHSHDIFSGLNQVTVPFDERLRFDQQEIQRAESENDAVLAASLRERHEQTTQQRKMAVREYVEGYKNQPAAVFIALRQLTHGMNHEELADLLAVFDPALKGTRHYDDLAQRVIDMERVSVGKPAPDFRLPDTEGNEISLSDLRGKYVLISFWASWCPYCREVNPDLVKAYAALQSDQFEILGVSLDREHEAWIKGIEDDGLTWPQVSDLKGWQSGPARTYVIRSIPQNVLISPDGIIVDKNLKYTDLQEIISDLLRQV